MKAPKELFRYQRGTRIFHDTYKPAKVSFDEPEPVKYIRADLAIDRKKLVDWLKQRQEQTYTIALDDLLQEVIDKVNEL